MPVNMTQVVAVSRYKNELGSHTDFFAVGDNGNAYTSSYSTGWAKYKHANSDWQSLGHPHGLPFAKGTNLAAVSRRYNNLDIFAIAGDGACYRTAFTMAKGWTGKPNGGGDNWALFAGGGTFPPGAPIVAISRSPSHLDVFAIAEGDLWLAWTYGENVVGNWQSLGRPAGSPPLTGRCKIDAVAVGEREYHVVLCGEREDDIWARRWNGDQHPWSRLAAHTPAAHGLSPVAPPAAALSAVKSSYGKCDVFAVFDNGEAFVSWTEGSSWHNFDRQGGRLHPGSPLTAVLDADNVDERTIRLFGIRTDGTVVTTTTDPRTRTTPPPWTELGAKGEFPPGTKLAAITALSHVHCLYGVTSKGTILATRVDHGKAGMWHTIGGNGKVKYCHADGGVRPIKFAPRTNMVSLQAEAFLAGDREVKVSGSGFTPHTPYRVVLRHCLDPFVQQEFSGDSYIADRGGWLACRLPVLNMAMGPDSGHTPAPSNAEYTLEIKIVADDGQSANTFVRVPAR